MHLPIRPPSRTHLRFLTLFLTTFLASRAIAQEFHNAKERQHVQAFLDSAVDRHVTGRLLARSTSPEAARLLVDIEEVSDEHGLLDVAWTLTRVPLDDPAHERVLLRLVERLGSLGTPLSLPLLEELAARPPKTLALVESCRKPRAVPVFDYQAAAKRAVFAIEERRSIAEYQALSSVDERVAWLVSSARYNAGSPRLQAALRLVGGIPPESYERLANRFRQVLGNTDVPARATSELLVEVYLQRRRLPSSEEFSQLEARAAERFLLESRRSEGELSGALAVARDHPDLGSTVVFLEGNWTVSHPREFLERGGASAAAVLARTPSPRITSLLAAIASDATASEPLRRQAVLGLLHQGTTEAKGTVEWLLERRRLPSSVHAKLEEDFGR